MIGSPSGVWFCLDVVLCQASMANVMVMSASVLGEWQAVLWKEWE